MARSAVEAGHDVVVYARLQDGLPATEQRDGGARHPLHADHPVGDEVAGLPQGRLVLAAHREVVAVDAVRAHDHHFSGLAAKRARCSIARVLRCARVSIARSRLWTATASRRELRRSDPSATPLYRWRRRGPVSGLRTASSLPGMSGWAAFFQRDGFRDLQGEQGRTMIAPRFPSPVVFRARSLMDLIEPSP